MRQFRNYLLQRGIRGIVVAALALELVGCSTYRRQFNSVSAQPPPPDSVAGAWKGTWVSEKNGHHGKLWCIMTPETDSMYQARFRATFLKVLHFTYTAHFEMKPHYTGWEFDGEANLGNLGGSYFYEGRATPTNMVSTYESKYDSGHFELQRPLRKP